MRTLLLMRGAPGCGKSTWIEQHNLKKYTLCPDDLRILCNSYSLNVDGSESIARNQDVEQETWKILFDLLEFRMSRGQFTVIDATCSKTKDIQQYKTLADQYRYRIYIVDFTNIPLEQCLKQNKMRPQEKWVPEEGIKNIYSRFKTQQIPGGVKIIQPNEFDTLLDEPIDLSEYKKLVFIGDIHGCYDTLMQYFKDGIDKDTNYIFIGDYLDRGNQNVETIKWLHTIYDCPNVCLLEGNHECFTKDTLFLTEDGWKLYDDIKDEKLAQVDLKTNLVSFDYPVARIEKDSNSVFSLKSFSMEQKITINHNIIYDGELKPLSSFNLASLKADKFKTSTRNNFKGVNYSNDFLKLLIWTYADGTIVYGEKGKPNNHKCRVQFHLAKDRKIEALKEVLDNNNIKYSITEGKPSDVGKINPKMIRFYSDDARKVYEVIGKSKSLPKEFMFVNEEQFNVILETMAITDGQEANERIIYNSTDLDNLTILQTASILNGHTAYIHMRRRGGLNKKPCYTLTIYKEKGGSRGVSKDVEVRKEEDQKVCCFQMPKGTLITKMNGNIVISGNCHISSYGRSVPSTSREFEYKTRNQLINGNYTEKEARMFYRKVRQMSHITYKGIEILACHGGIPHLNTNLLYVPSYDFIHGVGEYKDYTTNAETWMRETKENQYLIHGHRNTDGDDMRMADRVFNLEGQVEFGGQLRILELNENLEWNEIYLDDCQPVNEDLITEERKVDTVEEAITYLRNNKSVEEKKLGNGISSFNFTRQAFMKKNWNKQTILARGLFIDTDNNKIMARSYEKFFKIDEVYSTQMNSLKDKLLFPVKAYIKENGFLAIVSYDYKNDDLFIASKSTNVGTYTEYIKKQLEPYREKLLEHFRTSYRNKGIPHSYVFECIDIENDPHIIKYDKSKIVLLDIIFNELQFGCVNNYDLLKEEANWLGCPVKQLAYTFKTWEEFKNFYRETQDEYYKYEDEYVEGFVFVDSNGFMTKLKTPYYNEWKKLRGVADQTLRCGYITKTGMLTNSLENLFYGYCRDLYNKDRDNETKKYPFKTDIISLREKFLNR